MITPFPHRFGDRFQLAGLVHRVIGIKRSVRGTVVYARVERAEPNAGFPVLTGPEQVFQASALTDAQWLAPVGVER